MNKIKILRKLYLQFFLMCVLLLVGATTKALAAVEFSVDTDLAVASPGEKVTVSFTIGNSGTSTVEALSMVMRYPQQLRFVRTLSIIKASEIDTISCPSSSFCQSGDLMSFTLPDLPAGTAVTVNMVVEVDRNAVEGESIVFEPEIRIDGTQEVQASTSVIIKAEPFYRLSLRGSAQPVITGERLVYTLDYSNISDSPSTDTVATVTLPPGVSFVSATGSATEAGGEVAWQIGDLSVEESKKQTVIARVDAGVVSDGQALKARATITGVDSGFRENTVTTSYTTQVTSEPSLEVAIEVTPQIAKPGKLLQTLITVSNSTDTLLSDVQLKIRWPSHLNFVRSTYVSLGNDTNTVTCANVQNQFCSPGDVMVLNLSNIPATGGITVSVPAVVDRNASPGSLIRFDVEAKAVGVHPSRATEIVAVATQPPYLLSIHESSNPAPVDGQITYWVNYANAGVSTLKNSTLRLVLPAGMDFEEATNGGTHRNGVVTWSIGNLRTGYGGQRKVTAIVNAGEVQNGNIASALASMSGEDDGSQRQNAYASRDVRIGSSLAPAVDFKLDPLVFVGRDPSAFNSDLKNTGNRLLSDVRVILRYPEELSFIRVSAIDTGSNTNKVNCPSVSFCSNPDLMDFDLSNLRAGDTLRTGMPLQAQTEAISLIPFQGEVRVNGVQIKTVSNTGFLLKSFSPAIDPPVASRSVNIRPGGQLNESYGYRDGSTNQVTRQLRIRFNSRRQQLVFRVRGFDIDRSAEARVYLNNKLLGDLSTSRNNRHNAGDLFWIPKSSVRVGRTNEIKILHRPATDVWGVDRISLSTLNTGNRIRLRPGVVNRPARGWRYGSTRHRDGLEVLFTRRNKNLKFSLTGYDIDRPDELTVFVNGKRVGNLRKGRSNRLAATSVFTIRKADQIAGTNTIMILQKTPGEKWGVSGLLLR